MMYSPNIAERYLVARSLAFANDNAPPVSPALLRGYLDLLRGVKHSESGQFYSRKILITGHSPANHAMLKVIALYPEWEIEVR